jgi:hypothetical protein
LSLDEVKSCFQGVQALGAVSINSEQAALIDHLLRMLQNTGAKGSCRKHDFASRVRSIQVARGEPDIATLASGALPRVPDIYRLPGVKLSVVSIQARPVNSNSPDLDTKRFGRLKLVM